MFVGHFALGFAGKRAAPAVSPLDFVSYPYSHSLVAAAGGSILFGLGYWLFRRQERGGMVLGLLVLSHWVLDFVAHRPDLQLNIGSQARVGLGLWFSRPATLTVELLLFLAGIVIYERSTVPRDRVGRYGYWLLVVFLLAAYVAAVFGPPPPSVAALAWGGQSVWLLVFWGFWVDWHRPAKQS